MRLEASGRVSVKCKWEIPDQLTIERLGQYFPRFPNEGHTMLDIQGRTASCSDKGMRRRDFLRVGALGATGLTLADWLKMKAHGAVKEAKAKSVNTTFDTSNCSCTKPMRLDAHTHMYSLESIEMLRDHAAEQGITHYVAIIKDLKLLEILNQAGIKPIPVHWIDIPEHMKNPRLDIRVAGYKLHPRQTKLKDGGFFTVSESNVGNICREAASLQRPLIFHTDGDVPSACSLPKLAEIASNHTNATFIASHIGVYTQEDFVKKYTPEEWEPMVEPLFKENLHLLINVDNLYADTPIFGLDYPLRSSDPNFRFKKFVKVVDTLNRTQRKALFNKLFIGTDFPCFWDPPWKCSFQRKDPQASYAYQVYCMRTAFKQDYDENRMAQNFLNLLPEEFRQ